MLSQLHWNSVVIGANGGLSGRVEAVGFPDSINGLSVPRWILCERTCGLISNKIINNGIIRTAINHRERKIHIKQEIWVINLLITYPLRCWCDYREVPQLQLWFLKRSKPITRDVIIVLAYWIIFPSGQFYCIFRSTASYQIRKKISFWHVHF